MKKGFDTNVDLTKFASSLKNKDYRFVARYYNINNQSKNLTLAEAHILSNAGLSIVVVWENGFPIAAKYFTYEKGVFDGTAAYHYANDKIQQPGQTPIYFAVDYDASKEELENCIIPYFKGIADGFKAISKNNPVYQVGIYGSGLVCSSLKQEELVRFTWLAQSMGWRGSRSYSGFNIKQGKETTECLELGGVKGDPNESPDDNEGSFFIPSLNS